MEINYLVIFAAAVLAMVVSAVWYGPLFGNQWLRIIGADSEDLAARKKMQKEATPLYAIQFLITLLQVYILAYFIKGWSDVSGIEAALWIWLGFVMPTVAAAAMWTTEPTKHKWARFLIQSGCFLVVFIIFGYVLGTWG